MNAANRKAFLDAIAHSELGAGLLGVSDDGYNVIVGSTVAHPILFDSYANHPGRVVTMMIKGRPVNSTAAGRYQILKRYFDAYKTQLNLPDFSPSSQNKIAMQLILECGALDDIDAGRFDIAIGKCKSRWASLPGAGYMQHENNLADLRTAYVTAGGTVS